MLDKLYFQEARELEILINMSRLVQKFLPKQTDIDKILKIIQLKSIKRYTFTCYMIKDIQAGYLASSYFKDIYLYLNPKQITYY